MTTSPLPWAVWVVNYSSDLHAFRTEVEAKAWAFDNCPDAEVVCVTLESYGEDIPSEEAHEENARQFVETVARHAPVNEFAPTVEVL